MSIPNPYDKAARFAAKVEPDAFFAWALGVPAGALTFREWLDTRAVPFPGGGRDRTGDTVARVDRADTGEPWALAAEFQIEPDPLMFGRFMVYLGQLWEAVKPDPERGSRFNVGAVLLNFTGTGNASRDLRWPGTALVTQLGVVEWNLARENADDLLTAMETGARPRSLLPWVPLMLGAGEPAAVARWKALATGEPDFRRRANYVGLALIFATASKRKALWEQALEDVTVVECEIVNEWMALGEKRGAEKGRVEGLSTGRVEGRAAEAAVLLVAVLEAKHGAVPADLADAIRAVSDLPKLEAWVPLAVKLDTLAAFRTTSGL